MIWGGVGPDNQVWQFIDEILQKCSHERALQSFIAALFPMRAHT